MSKISIIKKVKIFNSFKKSINENKFELEQKFNMRIDKANRLYTVLNIPQDMIGEPYNLKKSDIDILSEKFVKEFISSLSIFLDSKNMRELYKVYEVKKVDKFSYLIVIGFSLFQSNKYYDNIYYKVIPTLTIISIIISLIFLL
jgi:hypothetical protein